MIAKRNKIWLSIIIAVVTIFLVLTVFSGCNKASAADETAAETKSEEISSNGSAGNNYNRQILTITGSTTLLEVCVAWTEGFMEKSGGEISVNGGGSGVGIADVINGAADIGNASRSIKDSEKDDAAANGVDIKEITVLYDGIAIITSGNISVPTLTIEQLSGIYTGVIINWSEVGGPDVGIIAAGRDSSSGTGEYFWERVVTLNKSNEDLDYGDNILRLQSNSDVVNQVAGNDDTIGYISLGYLVSATDGGANLVSVKDGDSEDVVPSVATVGDGSYPISRGLFNYVNAGNFSDIAKAYIDFVLSPDGQAIGEKAGFVSVSK